MGDPRARGAWSRAAMSFDFRSRLCSRRSRPADAANHWTEGFLSSARHNFRIEARSATRGRCSAAGLACLWTVTLAGSAFAQSAIAGTGTTSKDVAALEPQLIPPTVLEQRQPEYPPEALPRRLAGDVAVAVEIDASGDVTATSLIHGVAPELDRAAMETASRWRFRPAMRDGVAIASRVQLVFHFEPPPVALTPPTPLATPSGPRRQPSRQLRKRRSLRLPRRPPAASTSPSSVVALRRAVALPTFRFASTSSRTCRARTPRSS